MDQGCMMEVLVFYYYLPMLKGKRHFERAKHGMYNYTHRLLLI